ncbi:unnamed protein product [Spirodela intermedia]|uniref:Uncharacterized protein n=1 Tax=Spirodela intermedia TaxID=51605 RepID=A0A7I8J0J9_SPIIN|nr:unnamed protein product [Spirodela intermedia]CAA6662941.1 unnamed protein product [Spirodela intermedia]
MLASCSSRSSPLLTRAMATQKPATGTVGTKKGSTVFPVGEPGPREVKGGGSPIKLLTNVEKLRLLTKAEKAGLLSGTALQGGGAGVLSAATDPGTPGALLGLSLVLLVAGPLCVYLVPEQYPWEVVLQVAVVAVAVLGGSAAFAASNFVSSLQRSN